MEVPGAVPFRGRAKWGHVGANLVLAALGAFLAWVVFTQLPTDVVAMRVLAWYTVFAVVSTLALALALALTRRLPTVERARLDGEPALVLRAWPGDWWHANALDLGLAVLAGVLAFLGLSSDEDWVVPSLLVAVAGAWFLVRVILSVLGRRRDTALWITEREVVRDSAWGRERIERAHVVRVRRMAESKRLLLVLDRPARWVRCPRPWRPARKRASLDAFVVDCSMMGHDPEELAAWLRDQLVPARNGEGHATGGRTGRGPRLWNRLRAGTVRR